MSSSPSSMSSLILLWAGEDPAVYAVLIERLNAAGVPCKSRALGDDESTPSADPLPIDWKPRFGFEVAVLSNDLTAAQQILEKLLAEEPQDLEIPEQPRSSVEELPLTDDTEKNPTVEVWTGADDKLAEFITAALQENEIPIHLEISGQTHVYVSADNESRAREIVREVTEAAPPN
jgi:hypothetical protein